MFRHPLSTRVENVSPPLELGDIERELGLEGRLSLKHFAEFAAEEAHRLRARPGL